MSLSVFAMVLGAALLHAIWNILVKGQGDRLTIMAFISAVSGALSLLFLPFVDFPAPASWPYIWVSLIVHNAYYIFLVLAYKYGDLSHVYPLSRGSAPLIVTGLGARLSGSPHGYIFWYLALDTLPLAVFVLWYRRGNALQEIRRSWKIGVIASLMVVVSTWIITWALTLAPLALVSALRESSIVFAVLFGIVFLKEKLDLNRLSAITMTLAGTILLKTSAY